MTFFNFARFLPVFLLKKCPFFARFFIKFSPFEEMGTLLHGQLEGAESAVRGGKGSGPHGATAGGRMSGVGMLEDRQN